MRIGYARGSTQDQNLDLQIQALKQAGCERIFEDRMSGTRMDCPGLTEALSYLRPEEDELAVWKIDRIGRGMKGLINFVADLESKGINFLSITDQIDTGTSAGKFFYNVMSALAVMEKDLLRERTKAGLLAARRYPPSERRHNGSTQPQLFHQGAQESSLLRGSCWCRQVALGRSRKPNRDRRRG